MRSTVLLVGLCVIAMSGVAWGQLLQWNTFGNAGTETTEPSVFNDANIAATNLTQGTITAAANTNRFGGSNWFNTGNTNPSTLAEAIAGNDYIQFIVTPNSGFSFTPTSFVFQWDKSGTGPQNVALRSSADAFASNLGIVAPTASLGTSNTITITGLTNIAAATTFRLYGYGATATGGTGGFDVASNIVNVQLNGTTTSAGLSAPTLTTPTSTSITNTSAILGATISSDGGAAITARGTVWKTSTGVIVTDNPLSEGGTSTGAFSHSRTSLPVGTQIFYKGYATNSEGTSLSPEGNFYTLSNEPVSHITGFSATAVSGSQINLSWTTVTADGYLILRKTSSDPTGLPTDATGYSVGNAIGDATVASVIASGGTNSASITGLSNSTSYHFSIVPFGYNGSNAQTYNYKTDGTVPIANATTLGNAFYISSLATAFTENFNTLASTSTSSTVPAGWFFNEVGGNSSYTAGTGSGTAGDTYSFGATSNSERALGELTSGSLASTIGALITNTSGSTLTRLDVSYTGEQWRLGATGRQDKSSFEISLDASSLTTGSWTSITQLDFIAPNTTGSTGALDGNATANRTVISGTIGGLSVANSASFWIRWTPFDATGADDGLAIDDFSITANTGDVPGGTYSALLVNGTTTLVDNITVNGDLIVNPGGTLNAGSNIVTLKRNWTNSGTLNAGTSKFIMNGTAGPQTMSGSEFYDLEINNVDGVTMLTHETVNGTLTVTNGVLNTGSNKITITSNQPGAVVIPTTGGSITGQIERAIEAGNTGVYKFTNTNTYIVPSAAQPATTVTVTSVPGTNPPSAPGGNAVQRYYTISPIPTNFSADEVRLEYFETELNSINESNLVQFRWNGAAWVNMGGTPTPADNYVSLTGPISTWSDWALGDNTNPLPIQLASFTGILVNNRVKLDWATVSELNNYGFHVQKRATGTTAWNDVANSFTPGHGTTNQPQHYTFTDNAVITGAMQYRLKQVDLDGTIHFTDPILIESPTSVTEVAPKQFTLLQNYPNPFNPSTEIKFSVEAPARTTLHVYNALGQSIATLFDAVAEPGHYYKVTFNASNLASGLYLYRLSSGTRSELKKLLLLK